MRKLLWSIILSLLVANSIATAQNQRTTVNQLRVKTDANGYLMATGIAQTAPISQPTVFSNARIRTDANGYLLVVVAGGTASFSDGTICSAPSINFASQATLGFAREGTNSIVLCTGASQFNWSGTTYKLAADSVLAWTITAANSTAATDIQIRRTSAKVLTFDTDGAGGALNPLAMITTELDIGVTVGGSAKVSGAGCYLWNTRGQYCTPADGQFTLLNAAGGAGIGYDVVTDGTLKLRGRALTAGTGNLDVGAKITAYNNVATAGWGVASVVAAARFTGQTAAKASVATYTVGAADGSFEVGCNVLVTVATSHSFGCTVGFTDEGNTARTYFLDFAIAGGYPSGAAAITNGNGAVPYAGTVRHIRAKAATAITINTTGTFTTVTYNVEGIIKQVF